MELLMSFYMLNLKISEIEKALQALKGVPYGNDSSIEVPLVMVITRV
jgi:hypothetical protein